MFETGSDDLFLPLYQDEELVDNLLCSEELETGSSGSGLSLTEALLPLVESSASWVHSTRYKTGLCSSYSADGSCKFAERCQFAHGLHELRVPFRHPKYKTELCRSYHTTGYCYYGSRCLFVHNLSERRQAHQRRKNIPCRTFRSFGVCPFGTRCNFLHTEGDAGESVLAEGEEISSASSSQVQSQPMEWKPRAALCHTFSSFGFCLYGTQCRFHHSLPSKMRTCDQNQGGFSSPQLSPNSSGLPSCTSSNASTSSSPPTTPPLAVPSPDAAVHNAFTFSSQHLSDLLLPLALHLQRLESSKAQDIWDSGTL